MYTEYNGYSNPTPPPKKNGGWKIAVAVGAAILVLAILICATAVFVTWIRNYYAANDYQLSTETSAFTSAPETEPTRSAEPGTTAVSTAEATTRNNPIETTPVAQDTEAKSTPDIYSQNVDAVVSISCTITYNSGFMPMTYTSTGSGYVVSSDGYIFTCYHVVENANAITVTLYNGTEYEASYVGGDEDSDIAVIKVDAEGMQAVTLGNSDDIIVGEEAIVIGNPEYLEFSVSKGIISATDRVINVDDNQISAFQTDAAINSGNSGGPVFNNRGEVIGMVDAKYASSTIEGLAFALPINEVLKVANDVITYGYVTGRPYFGISVSTAMISRGYAVNGARVEVVDEDSCAGTAGLKVGDVITAVDDIEVTSASALISARDKYKAGDTATLTVWRSGESITLTITFDEAKS